MTTRPMSRAITALTLVLAALFIAAPAAHADEHSVPTPEEQAAACVARINVRSTQSVTIIEARAAHAVEAVTALLEAGQTDAAQAVASEAIQRLNRRALRTVRRNHQDAGRCAIRLIQRGRPDLAGVVLGAAGTANQAVTAARIAAVTSIQDLFGG